MLPSISNIRVFVQWSEQTVFAGEDIECQITFKNIAAISGVPRLSPHSTSLNGFPGREGQRKITPLQSPIAQSKNSITPNIRANQGHRLTLSLNVPASSRHINQGSRTMNNRHSEAGTEERSHKRSVSIISLGISELPGDETVTQRIIGEGSRRPSRGHIRSSSLQIVPRRSGLNGAGPLSAPFTQRSTNQLSPGFHASSTTENPTVPADQAHPERPRALGRQPGIETAPGTPRTPNAHKVLSTRRKDLASFPQNFTFPAQPTSLIDQRSADRSGRNDELGGHYASQVLSQSLFPRSKDNIPTINEQSVSSTKIISPAISGGTPRSSGEFYSLSNNSTETLASDYLPQQLGRIQQKGTHARRMSNVLTINQHKVPEVLMMGYAQIHGSFTLDGSLVNQAPFEEVKRRGVLGGQGGGVIGVEASKRDSGLLRSFGWGSIGESLGGLLGSGELSSIKDMRGIASSKSVPLLSTPQSILFVDLHLAPGESRSYKYSFRLPRGLPPSHRGKAIKIIYNLVIGTQRPGGTKEQQVKSVEIPFRILGSVNDHGELLGHDLMSPYIILRDQARIQSLDSATSNSTTQPSKFIETSQSTKDDFLTYVDDLLTRPRQNSNLGLLSPTEARASRRFSFITEPSSIKEAIDLAILRSNLATESQQSANRFEVSRNGRRVAVVMLARPAYRLGETVTAAIEFIGAEVPCHALHASLEMSEKVDGAIALRSDASIHRVTRKVHSSHSEVTLFARRIVFSPTIPSSATPSFITSGVSLEWKILIEFVTPRFDYIEDSKVRCGQGLLEQISRDDRGLILAAVEGMECESFEVAVPLRVYGALVSPVEKNEEVRGLVV